MEVEAYLYMTSIVASANNGMFANFNGSNSVEGDKYTSAMNNLLMNTKFDQKLFKEASKNLAKGHPTTIYNKLSYSSDYKPLIDKFYPLIK
jgi:hypothetical protein